MNRSNSNENIGNFDESVCSTPPVFGRRLENPPVNSRKSSKKSELETVFSSSKSKQYSQNSEIISFTHEFGNHDRTLKDADEFIDDNIDTEVDDHKTYHLVFEPGCSNERGNTYPQRIAPSSKINSFEKSSKTDSVKPSSDITKLHVDKQDKVYKQPNKNNKNTKVKTNDKAELFFKAMDCKRVELTNHDKNDAIAPGDLANAASRNASSVDKDTLALINKNIEVEVDNTDRKVVDKGNNDTEDIQVITIDDDLDSVKAEKEIRLSKNHQGNNKSSKSQHRSRGSRKNYKRKHDGKKASGKRHSKDKQKDLLYEIRKLKEQEGELFDKSRKQQEKERKSKQSDLLDEIRKLHENNKKIKPVDLLDEIRKEQEKEREKKEIHFLDQSRNKQNKEERIRSKKIRSLNRKMKIDLKDEIHLDKIRDANITKYKIKEEKKEEEEKAKRKRKQSEERKQCEEKRKRRGGDWWRSRSKERGRETSSKQEKVDVKKGNSYLSNFLGSS